MRSNLLACSALAVMSVVTSAPVFAGSILKLPVAGVKEGTGTVTKGTGKQYIVGNTDIQYNGLSGVNLPSRAFLFGIPIMFDFRHLLFRFTSSVDPTTSDAFRVIVQTSADGLYHINTGTVKPAEDAGTYTFTSGSLKTYTPAICRFSFINSAAIMYLGGTNVPSIDDPTTIDNIRLRDKCGVVIDPSVEAFSPTPDTEFNFQ